MTDVRQRIDMEFFPIIFFKKKMDELRALTLLEQVTIMSRVSRDNGIISFLFFIAKHPCPKA